MCYDEYRYCEIGLRSNRVKLQLKEIKNNNNEEEEERG